MVQQTFTGFRRDDVVAAADLLASVRTALDGASDS